jgi:hypothetical protein
MIPGRLLDVIAWWVARFVLVVMFGPFAPAALWR